MKIDWESKFHVYHRELCARDDNPTRPYWEALGFYEYAPHVFGLRASVQNGLSAEKTWEHLRENLRRVRG